MYLKETHIIQYLKLEIIYISSYLNLF